MNLWRPRNFPITLLLHLLVENSRHQSEGWKRQNYPGAATAAVTGACHSEFKVDLMVTPVIPKMARGNDFPLHCRAASFFNNLTLYILWLPWLLLSVGF